MVAEIATLGTIIILLAAEGLHARRCAKVAALAFGPSRKPAAWAKFAPVLRIAAASALCWATVTLLLLEPKVHRAKSLPENEQRHLVILLDVSPSMHLQDAGEKRDTSRMKRASEVMHSLLNRVAIGQYKTTVIAFYNGAKAVVEDTKDMAVVDNILDDLPMQFAFNPGKTDIFSGLREAAKTAHSWNPRSATLIILSDGDTVSATGMPELPPSIDHVLVIGVGDAATGSFIDGRQSRQDSSMLRQLAMRLNGEYHDGNSKHLPSDLVRRLTLISERDVFERLTRREYALIALASGTTLLAFLPLLLALFGSAWKPGVPLRTSQKQTPEHRQSVNRQRDKLYQSN